MEKYKKIGVSVWYQPNLSVPDQNRYLPKFHQTGIKYDVIIKG